MKAALLIVALGACVSSSSIECSDGTLCPSTSACVQLTNPATTVCASHDQVAACASMPDGTACSTQPGSQCRDGVCWPFRCGDGRQDPNEACDDGNTLDGDGCSSTCTSTEVCGNGIADPVHRVVQPDGTVRIDRLEECDDGNAADHDGCNTHCELEQPGWAKVVPAGPIEFFSGSIAYDADHAQLVMYGEPGNQHRNTWLWDGEQWLPTDPATSPTAVTDASMAYDAATRRIVLFGGSSGSTQLAETWEWNGQTWSQHMVASSPLAREAEGMTYDSARKRVVMFGGHYTTSQNPDGGSFGDTWEWDGTKWTETTVAGPAPRGGPAMTYDPLHGVVVMFGGAPPGHNGIFVPDGDTWTYDGTMWTQQTPASSPPARTNAMIAWDAASQQVVMYGGDDGQRALQDMWAWNGSAWTELAATNPPGALESGMMASDPVRGRVLMFGGGGSSQTWEWNGTAWRDATPVTPQITETTAAFDAHRGRAVLFDGTEAVETTGPDWFTSSVVAPGPRDAPALAYDSKRRVTVLFGGNAQLGIAASDTWTWDGATWSPQMVMNAPPARSDAQMVYDRKNDQIVLFGGVDSSGAFLADTWLWDGTTWHDATPAQSPSARTGFAIGYDDKRERVILYGGGTVDIAGNPVALGDTWSWDGHTWTPLPAATQPGPRMGAVIGWNAPREHLVLFSGVNTDIGSVPTTDAFEWDGAAWLAIPATNPPPGRPGAVAFPAPHGVYIAGGANRANLDDVWLLEWDSPRQFESCALDVDDDGDGRAGCADPDCGYWCGTCGDGTCDPLETCRTCPGDCACTAVCGDAFCDAPETHASCPGDCP